METINNIDDFMNEILDNDTLNKLESLSNYSFVFGISSLDGKKEVDVDILNTDNSTTTMKMKLADVMYFTENGTITLPAQHILDKLRIFANFEINQTISKIIDKILLDHISDDEIYNELNLCADRITMQIPSECNSIISNNNKIGALLKKENTNKYLYDLKNLNKYIKCKIIKK